LSEFVAAIESDNAVLALESEDFHDILEANILQGDKDVEITNLPWVNLEPAKEPQFRLPDSRMKPFAKGSERLDYAIDLIGNVLSQVRRSEKVSLFTKARFSVCVNLKKQVVSAEVVAEATTRVREIMQDATFRFSLIQFEITGWFETVISIQRRILEYHLSKVPNCTKDDILNLISTNLEDEFLDYYGREKESPISIGYRKMVLICSRFVNLGAYAIMPKEMAQVKKGDVSIRLDTLSQKILIARRGERALVGNWEVTGKKERYSTHAELAAGFGVLMEHWLRPILKKGHDLDKLEVKCLQRCFLWGILIDLPPVRSELLREVLVTDFHQDGDTPYVHFRGGKTATSGGKEVILPLGKVLGRMALVILEARRKERNPHFFLNANNSKFGRRGIYAEINYLGRLTLGKRLLGPHIFRHAYCTKLYEEGALNEANLKNLGILMQTSAKTILLSYVNHQNDPQAVLDLTAAQFPGWKECLTSNFSHFLETGKTMLLVETPAIPFAPAPAPATPRDPSTSTSTCTTSSSTQGKQREKRRKEGPKEVQLDSLIDKMVILILNQDYSFNQNHPLILRRSK